MTPGDICRSRFVQEFKGQLITPTDGSYTLRSQGGLKVFDYFVVSSGISKVVKQVTVKKKSPLPPHSPLDLALFPNPAQMQALEFRKPPPLPKQQAIGPIREPPSWDSVLGFLEDTVGVARSGKGAETQRRLDIAYKLWANMAE
eukprot:203047-Pyramimonas_sp.AAC.1